MDLQSCGDDLLEIIFLALLDVGTGLGLSSGEDFSTFSSSRFLDLSLQLFFWLSLGVPLGEDSLTPQPVVGLVFHESLVTVVCQTVTD